MRSVAAAYIKMSEGRRFAELLNPMLMSVVTVRSKR
jgi:hypothetical protein